MKNITGLLSCCALIVTLSSCETSTGAIEPTIEHQEQTGTKITHYEREPWELEFNQCVKIDTIGLIEVWYALEYDGYHLAPSERYVENYFRLYGNTVCVDIYEVLQADSTIKRIRISVKAEKQ